MRSWKKLISLTLIVVMCFSSSLNVFAATTDPTQSQREKNNAKLARSVAAQGMVLLEQNEEKALPIAGKSKPIALFGNGAIRTIRGGTGSGDPFNGGLSGGGDPLVNQSDRYHVNIYDTFVREGYTVTTSEFLERWVPGYDEETLVQATNPLATFVYPEMELTNELVQSSSLETDTAIYVISRNAGEGADRNKATKTGKLSDGTEFEVGDYELTAVEKENLTLVGQNFDKVVVVLNVGGVIDTKFFDEIEGLDSLLLMGQGGQEAGDALFDVVTGAVTPSGKLTSTWAVNYSDYPAAQTFANNDGNIQKEVYNEGIYVGYRYFDTFGITPKYEFGYGLSFTNFDIKVKEVSADAEKVTVKATVKNTGDTYSGKEVVQVYYSAPDSAEAEKSYQELAAYAKTDELAPGESQILEISYNTADMAYYNETLASYILDAGDYVIRVGNSSRNTSVASVVKLDNKTVIERLSNQMPVPEEENLIEWSKKDKTSYSYAEEVSEIAQATVLNLASSDFPEASNNASPYDNEIVNTYTSDPNAVKTQDYEKIVNVADKSDSTLLDVYNNKVTIEEFVAQMTLEELATLNSGSGWGVSNDNAPIVGSNSDTIPGAAGETTTKYFDKYGIPSIVLADGPGGIRIKQEYTATDVISGEEQTFYQYCTAWPVSFVRAQTWDVDLVKEVGRAMAVELEEMGITLILGPSLNIHRDPLNGRNFEYFSEDPIISGTMAAVETLGIQSIPGVGATLKHYAANNQESNRNAVDTIVSERALREIYLKGFEIAVKASQPMSIMTSYNKINGIPTADDYDLNTDLARGEWGFDGLIMTDWNGGSSTPLISMHAGNDLIMPGGANRILNIMGGVMDVKPVFAGNGQIDLMEIKSFITMYEANWGEFVLSPTGSSSEVAQLADGYEATVDAEGNILVNGEPIYRTYQSSWWEPGTWKDQLTTEYAEVSEDGKQITYFGDYKDNNTITLGDVQKSTINNLKIIMQSIAMKNFYADENIELTPYSSQYELATYNYTDKSDIYDVVHVSLNKNKMTLTKGDSVTLTATMDPSYAFETMSWSSSDPRVATVDQNGAVAAVAKGSSTITVTLSNGQSASCIVKVKAKGAPVKKENPSNGNKGSKGSPFN
jgi:beta-glucosidase